MDGGWLLKRPSHDSKLGISPSPSVPPEKGEKLAMELFIIIDHDHTLALIINMFLLTVFVALFYIKYSLLLEGKVLS